MGSPLPRDPHLTSSTERDRTIWVFFDIELLNNAKLIFFFLGMKINVGADAACGIRIIMLCVKACVHGENCPSLKCSKQANLMVV